MPRPQAANPGVSKGYSVARALARGICAEVVQRCVRPAGYAAASFAASQSAIAGTMSMLRLHKEWPPSG